MLRAFQSACNRQILENLPLVILRVAREAISTAIESVSIALVGYRLALTHWAVTSSKIRTSCHILPS